MKLMCKKNQLYNNKNIFRLFVYRIVSVTLITCFLVVAINFIVDPFFVFNQFNIPKINLIRVCETKNERISKIPQMKLDKSRIEEIFVGGSKIGWALDDDYLKYLEKYNRYIKKETISAASLQESIIIVKNMKILHPELKTVYFGLDFYSLGKPIKLQNPNFEIINNKQLILDEIKPLLFSIFTFQCSINTIIANLKNPVPSQHQYDYPMRGKYRKEYHLIGDAAEHKFSDTIFTHFRDDYKNYKLNSENFSDLKDFIQYAKEQNINVIFFVTPSHVSDFISIYNAGIYSDYKKFKIELSKITNFYDFSIIDKYSTENINSDIKFFRDSIHATGYLGELMSDCLLGYSCQQGIFLTENSIHTEIKKNEQYLIQYMKNNNDVVGKIKNWSQQ